MPSQLDDNTTDDPRLNELLAKYLQAVESGEPIDQEQLLREHPDYAHELREFFADKSQIDKVAGAVNAVGPTPNEQTRAFVDMPTLPPGITTPLDAATLDSGVGPTAASRAGTMLRYFGDYELLNEIARGGMGVVFKARQVKLNRVVAIKMILAGQLASKEDVQRFYTEAEAAAGLDHPGIVPIFEVGEQDGQHFFSMGFIDGESLAARLSNGPLPPREAAELVRKVAEAIQFTHDRGVIHRDLKPANVLLKQSREARVTSPDLGPTASASRLSAFNSQPMVTDFGLAKKSAADSNLTGTGQILGTPSYMPPEQAAGRLSEMRETADVYSLGAILYATLTGRPPFQADNPLDTLMQVLERDPVAPRTLNPKVPLDLETICLKCLEKDRRRRYDSARSLGDELQRFLNGEPILARPISRTARAWRWCKRNPVVASLSAAVMLSLIVGTAVSSMFAVEARRRAAGETEQRQEADRQTANAREQLTRSDWLLYANQIASARREWELHNTALALSQLNRTRPDFRGWEFEYLSRQLGQSLRTRLQGHAGPVLAVALSVDDRLVASASRDKTVKLWDAETGKLLRTLDTDQQYITQLDFSADGERLAGISSDGKLRIWTVASGLTEHVITTTAIASKVGGTIRLPLAFVQCDCERFVLNGLVSRAYNGVGDAYGSDFVVPGMF